MATYPLTEATVSSFGPFGKAAVQFSPGLNVIIGDNATGKSQLMKLLYAATKSLREADAPTKKSVGRAVASKLQGTFQPQSLGRLARRVQGRSAASVRVKYGGIREPLQFGFSSHARTDVSVASVPDRPLEDEAVFLPTRELLSLGSSFLALYDDYDTGFEETWRDTVALLQKPALKGPRGARANAVLEPFSGLLHGATVFEDDGRFFLHQPGIGNLEASLVAEGHRKLAMIIRLIANGSLLDGGYLFWDEPEANLNPASQRAIVRAISELTANGTQVFVATHSTFLLRELEMAAGQLPVRYLGLSRGDQSADDPPAPVRIDASDELAELPLVAALDAEVEQASRYLAL